MRFFWNGVINYSIVNPEVDSNWLALDVDTKNIPDAQLSFRNKLRLQILKLIRYVYSQRSRNANLDIFSLIRCPKCRSENLERKSSSEIKCLGCGCAFKVENNLFYLK